MEISAMSVGGTCYSYPAININNKACFNMMSPHYQQHQSTVQHYHVVNSTSSTASSLTSSASSSGVCDSHATAGSSSSSSSSCQPESECGSAKNNGTNLIVNYLPQTMSELEIRALFEQVDHVERCKLIKNKQNQSLCYGFVKYAKQESAEQAIKRFNGLKIENKTIKVNYF